MKIKYLILILLITFFSCKKVAKSVGKEVVEQGIKKSTKKSVSAISEMIAKKQAKELLKETTENGIKKTAKNIVKKTSSELIGENGKNILDQLTEKTLNELSQNISEESSEKILKNFGKSLFNDKLERKGKQKIRNSIHKIVTKGVEKNKTKEILKNSDLPKELIEKILKMNKKQQIAIIFDLSKANPKARSLLKFITENPLNLKSYTFLSNKNTSYSIRSNRSYIEQISSQFKKGINTPTIKLNNYGKSQLNIKRRVQIDGITYIGKFPNFSKYRKVRMRLPKEYYLKSRNEHFKYLDKELSKRVTENPEFAKKFTKKQIEEIKLGKGLKGYTWHHNESKGIMDLVETKIHNSTPHIGGNALWAKGTLDL